MTFDKFYLQLFAENAADTGAQSNDAGAAAENTSGQQGQEPTAGEQFNKLLADNPALQSEFDRRVTQALAKQKGKLDTATQDAIQKAVADAQRRAGQSAEEAAAEELENLRKENETLKAAQTRAGLRQRAAELLSEKKLTASPGMLELLTGADEDSTADNIAQYEAAILAAVKAAQTAAATGTTPRNYNNKGGELSEFDKRIAKYK